MSVPQTDDIWVGTSLEAMMALGKKGEGRFLLGSRLSSFCQANSQHLTGQALHQGSSAKTGANLLETTPDRNTKS